MLSGDDFRSDLSRGLANTDIDCDNNFSVGYPKVLKYWDTYNH